jgi:hypothetical protein
MAEALAWLRTRGLRVKQPTPFQIKVADVSYYPERGTIFVDGEKRRRPETGLAALEKLLINRRLIRKPRERSIDEIGPYNP